MNVIMSPLFKVRILAPRGKVFKTDSDFSKTLSESEMKTLQVNPFGASLSFITSIPQSRCEGVDWSDSFEQHLVAI